ncbi:MAG: hypothetical protein K0Q63_2647 [Paenibacillus sp.]|nr:hypothetical protein [Paenibacillus sp.]
MFSINLFRLMAGPTMQREKELWSQKVSIRTAGKREEKQ